MGLRQSRQYCTVDDCDSYADNKHPELRACSYHTCKNFHEPTIQCLGRHRWPNQTIIKQCDYCNIQFCLHYEYAKRNFMLPYCYTHRCYMDDCNALVLDNQNTTTEHSREKYCDSHKCKYKRCSNKRRHRSNYCTAHSEQTHDLCIKCGGCKPENEYKYCYKCRCSTVNCRLLHSPGRLTCTLHVTKKHQYQHTLKTSDIYPPQYTESCITPQ
jgi:hypothetical protein